MKTTTLQKRATALSKAAQGLQVIDGKLVPSKDFIQALQAAMEIEKEVTEFFAAIKTYMEVNKVSDSDFAEGYLRLYPQSRYAVDGKVMPRFLKETINTEEVKHYKLHHKNKLPKGIVETKFNKLGKKVAV